MGADRIAQFNLQVGDYVTVSYDVEAREYNGKWCGVDPFSAQEIEMFCGDEEYTAHSVEDAMTVRLFDGRSLDEIAEGLTNIDL